jgi:hypothetical protein
MSEQMPQDQVDPTPLDPSTLTTEHGYTPDYPVYPGEENRVHDPNLAHVMANASKTTIEDAIVARKKGEELLNEADSTLNVNEAARKIDAVKENLYTAKLGIYKADSIERGAGETYVDNEKMTERLRTHIDEFKKSPTPEADKRARKTYDPGPDQSPATMGSYDETNQPESEDLISEEYRETIIKGAKAERDDDRRAFDEAKAREAAEAIIDR